ncbi:MAG TPA: hypothetical protein VGH58_09935 [Solirubrobacterales bacterium]|jgi:hypothetical protein
MYFIPLIAILLIALAIFFSPIFAVIIFIFFLIGLGAYKFLGRGAEPEHAPPPKETTPPANTPGAATTATGSSDEDSGLWGETWPEQRQGEEPS